MSAPGSAPTATLATEGSPSLASDAERGTGSAEDGKPRPATERPRELGGPVGPEPTRFGDWERGGRCIDF